MMSVAHLRMDRPDRVRFRAAGIDQANLMALARPVELQPPRVFIQKIAAVTRARSSLNAAFRQPLRARRRAVVEPPDPQLTLALPIPGRKKSPEVEDHLSGDLLAVISGS
jgi:hypothetical protein